MIPAYVLKLHLGQTHILGLLFRLDNILLHLYHLPGVARLSKGLLVARLLEHLELEPHQRIASPIRFLRPLLLIILQLGLIVIFDLVQDYVLGLLDVDLVAEVLTLFVHLDHLLVVLTLYWALLHHLLQLPDLRFQDVQLLLPHLFQALKLLSVGFLDLADLAEPNVAVLPQLCDREVLLLQIVLNRQSFFLCFGRLHPHSCDFLLQFSDLVEQLAPGHHMVLNFCVVLGLIALQGLIIRFQPPYLLPVIILLLLSLLLQPYKLLLHLFVLPHPLIIFLGDLLLLLPISRLDLPLGELETFVVFLSDFFGEIHPYVFDVFLLLLQLILQLADCLLEGQLLLLLLGLFLKEEFIGLGLARLQDGLQLLPVPVLEVFVDLLLDTQQTVQVPQLHLQERYGLMVRYFELLKLFSRHLFHLFL